MCLKERVNKESDFSTVIFTGGLERGQIEEFMEGLKGIKSDYGVDIDPVSFQKALEKHVDREADHNPPAGALPGCYNEQQTDEWIKKLQLALSW